MRRFLPYERYELHTSLTTAEVLARLEAATDPGKRAAIPELKTLAPQVYEGTIAATGFELRRSINHRNSLLPVIKGTITATQQGTAIRITMLPGRYVRLFLLFWFGALGIIFLLLLLAEITGLIAGNGFSGAFFVPLGMVVFGLLLVHFGFGDESENSKVFFAKLLAGNEQLDK